MARRLFFYEVKIVFYFILFLYILNNVIFRYSKQCIIRFYINTDYGIVVGRYRMPTTRFMPG
jgi:hypothetical protein